MPGESSPLRMRSWCRSCAGVLAVVEAIARPRSTGATLQFALVLCLLALSTTLPLLSRRPRGRCGGHRARSVLSLAVLRHAHRRRRRRPS